MERLRFQYLAAFAYYLHISPVDSEKMQCEELVALTYVVDQIIASEKQNAQR